MFSPPEGRAHDDRRIKRPLRADSAPSLPSSLGPLPGPIIEASKAAVR